MHFLINKSKQTKIINNLIKGGKNEPVQNHIWNIE